MKNTISQEPQQWYYSNKFLWIIIFIGTLLRLVLYIHNTSLWFDESRNALTIINHSLSEFIPLQPDIFVTIPFGFVMFEKFAIQAFGNSEFAFKLFPLLSGIISLFLFYQVAKTYLSPKSVPVALGLFAILDPLVYFSSHVKPYSSDVTITLLLYISAIYFYARKLTALRIIAWGALGAVVVWFSHPSIFVLAGIGTTLTIFCVVRKEWTRVVKLLLVFLLWISSFIIVYLMYTRPLVESFAHTNNDLFWMKQKAFMPLLPKSISDIQWFVDILFRIFDYPVGLTLSGIAALAFFVGCVSIYQKQKGIYFILIAPVLITFIASGFHKYALAQGQILFLVPLLLLFIAEGAEYIRDKTSDNASIIGVTLIGLLFVYPLMWSTYHMIKPDSREEIKPVLRHIKDNWQTGDILYVYYMSQFAFEYYTKYHPGNYRFNENEYIIGRAPRDWYATYKKEEFTGYWNPDKPFSQPSSEIFTEYVEALNKFRGHKRVWVLFSSIVPKDGIIEENFFLFHLDTIGKKIDSFGRLGIASVYLYDLRGQ